MSLALLNHHLLLNVFRMLVHPSSGDYDLLWIYFMASACIRTPLNPGELHRNTNTLRNRKIQHMK